MYIFFGVIKMAYFKNIIPTIYQALQIQAAAERRNKLGVIVSNNPYILKTAYVSNQLQKANVKNIKNISEKQQIIEQKQQIIEQLTNQKDPIIIKRGEEKDYTGLSGPTQLSKYFGKEITSKKITYEEFKEACAIKGTMAYNPLTGIPAIQITKLLIAFGAIIQKPIYNTFENKWLNDGTLLSLRIGNTIYQMKAFENKRILKNFNETRL